MQRRFQCFDAEGVIHRGFPCLGQLLTKRQQAFRKNALLGPLDFQRSALVFDGLQAYLQRFQRLKINR
ncbi:hypothetical protein D3C76_1595370 [compost metagenome]